MARQIHHRGWLDTRERIGRVFKEDELVRKLMTRNGTIFVNKQELTEAEASRWALLLTYGAYLLRDLPLPTMQHIKAVSIGELLAPVLPATHFLGPNEADEKIRNIIIHYMHHETALNRGRTLNNFISAHNAVPLEDQDAEYAEIDNNISDVEFLTSYGARYCDYLLLESNTDQSLKPLDLFTTLYISVAKRGNVTGDFITKITNGMQDDLQFSANLDEEIIELVYKFYGGQITADNAHMILDRWLDDIPEVALRVRLTLQQATNSGLTSFVTIGRAIRKYPDFPWTKLNVLTGGEITNFSAAVALVRGNQYFGFNKSLGTARSTLFQSVAYVAKELLINLNGEMSLKKYMGWVKAPKNAAIVRAMIEAYKTEYVARQEECVPSVEEIEQLNHLHQTLGNAQNASMFV